LAGEASNNAHNVSQPIAVFKERWVYFTGIVGDLNGFGIDV
jgi:hypothetical protein